MRVVDRFMAKVERAEDGCWIWRGGLSSGRYGAFKFDGKQCLAHRISYELFVGPIPDGLQIDHLCRVMACVNPDHLEPVTARENQRRGTSPASINAHKTHCKRGHEFTMENTRLYRGQRNCRTCHREYMRGWKQCA